jgi:YcxB-like protein
MENSSSDAFKPEAQVRGVYDPRTSSGAPIERQNSGPTEITIFIERCDIDALQRFLSDRLDNPKYFKVLHWLVVVALTAAIFFVSRNSDYLFPPDVARYGIWFFAAGLFTPITLWSLNYRLRIAPANRKTTNAAMERATGRFRVIIGPQSFAIEDVQHQNITKWSGFVEIAATAHHIFLLQDPYSASVIPRNAFANNEEADKFLNQLRSYHHLATER